MVHIKKICEAIKNVSKVNKTCFDRTLIIYKEQNINFSVFLRRGPFLPLPKRELMIVHGTFALYRPSYYYNIISHIEVHMDEIFFHRNDTFSFSGNFLISIKFLKISPYSTKFKEISIYFTSNQ